jgi:hypothetical protein
MSKSKVIKMSFPVAFVVDWVKKWADATKKVSKTEAEQKIIDDVVTMVCVAQQVMVQKQEVS